MQKNSRSQANEFLLDNVGAIEICWKNNKKKSFWKNIQVQLMNFYYINVEAIGKCVIMKKINFEKKITSPVNEFLLHTAEAIGKLK